VTGKLPLNLKSVKVILRLKELNLTKEIIPNYYPISSPLLLPKFFKSFVLSIAT